MRSARGLWCKIAIKQRGMKTVVLSYNFMAA
nr:MAG TPA: hypothetical protein [Caudoviricetes sp.]